MSRYAKQSQRALLLAGAIAVGGCGGTGTEPQRDPSGTYVLVSVNGSPLPGVVSRTTDRTTEMLASSVTITANQRFAFSGRTRMTTASGVNEFTQTGMGSWQLRGSALDMVPDDPSVMAPTTLTWDGAATLTANDPTGTVPVVMVFRK